jgi:hypothetical protein
MPPTWLGPIRQSAFIVDDIDAAAMEWVNTHGIGPFFAYRVEVEGAVYKNRPTPMRADMALAQTGMQQIELIRPDADVPSIYNDFIDAGLSGLHHVCYWADLDRSIGHFTDMGCTLVQHGRTGNDNRFAYLTGTPGVPYVEIVDPNDTMARFFSGIASAAENWDGTDPIRR